jgi:hypothetical protein
VKREPPAAFVARLQAHFPDVQAVRFNEAVGRWEFVLTSAVGRPVSQFYGWFRNPLTGNPIEPDPVTGLVPFRDLDATAQEEIFRSLEATYLGNRHDGFRNVKAQQDSRRRFNRELTAARVRQRAVTLAELFHEVNIQRAWVKDHPHAKDPRGRSRATRQLRRHRVTHHPA